jgi:glycosyltransferase involved in cell wall biosynthesis
MNELPAIANVEDPLITIAIPTFNRVDFLKSCLSSAFSQTYPCLEVLVSDNASTDGTEEFLAALSDPRLRVIRQRSNIGLLPNWNACLSAASGEYIVFVPDDDSIAPHFLDRCVGLVRLQPQVPVVIALANGSRIVAGVRSVVHPASGSRTLGTGIWDGIDIFMEFLRHQITVQSCTAFMRTEYLRLTRGFRVDLPYAADVAAWGSLLMMGKCGLVNEDCGSFTIHLESPTKSNSLEVKLRDYNEVIETLATVVRTKTGIDPVKRVKILNEAHVHINDGITGLMLRDLREGGKPGKIMAAIWRYRRDLFVRGLTKKNFRKLIRLIILVLLPSRLRDLLRRICVPPQYSPHSPAS